MCLSPKQALEKFEELSTSPDTFIRDVIPTKKGIRLETDAEFRERILAHYRNKSDAS